MSHDIVKLLRDVPRGIGGHYYHLMQKAAGEIERLRELSGDAGKLREERDQARREVCAFVSGRYRKDVVTLDRAAALEEAKRRGWDCFKEATDDR